MPKYRKLCIFYFSDYREGLDLMLQTLIEQAEFAATHYEVTIYLPNGEVSATVRRVECPDRVPDQVWIYGATVNKDLFRLLNSIEWQNTVIYNKSHQGSGLDWFLKYFAPSSAHRALG